MKELFFNICHIDINRYYIFILRPLGLKPLRLEGLVACAGKTTMIEFDIDKELIDDDR